MQRGFREIFRKKPFARMKFEALILTFIIPALAFGSAMKPCKYWCRTEEESVYYCCPSGKPESRIADSIWPIMSSPIFWIGLIGTSIGIHAQNNRPMIYETPEKKAKECPPMRSACPRSYDWYNPPNLCDHDEECNQEMEKCCFDVCLEHKVCKPIE